MIVAPVKLFINNQIKKAQTRVYFAPESDTFEREVEISDKTKQKARKMVISSLKSKNPIESIVLIGENRILAYAPGDYNTAVLPKECRPLLDDPSSKLTIYHSHVPRKNGKTLPLSMADARNLLKAKGLVAVEAIDKQGRFSRLEKTPFADKSKINSISVEFNRYMANAFSNPNEKETYEALLDRYYKMKSGEVEIEDYDDIKVISYILTDYVSRASEFDHTPKLIHDFWTEKAPELGLKYSTNFEF